MAPMIIPTAPPGLSSSGSSTGGDGKSSLQEANKITKQVITCVVIAAMGGLMFGYDIGISGGVTGMDHFLLKFFPRIYDKKHHAKENNYCKFNDHWLQLFTSSLYLAAIFASFLASKVCNKCGRRWTMRIASICFLVGAILDGLAVNLGMLIVGRLLLGVGVGFGNQAVPLFISEIAPSNLRGGLNITFQLMITIGILAANIVNAFTANHLWGWRYSLGGAAVPALFLLLGSLYIVETPTSLIERGKLEQGRKALDKIRGTTNTAVEFQELLQACEAASQVKDPFKELKKRRSRPQLICSILLQIFQQFTGINVVMFYAPVLFQTMGFGSASSLLSSIIMGTVNVLATAVAMYVSDKAGRRVLLVEGAVQMFVAQTAIGGILIALLKATNSLNKEVSIVVVVLVCVFVSGFAWSWGPLGWLIPSEVFPLETRTAGFFIAVGTNMLCTFIIAQFFLTSLCACRAWSFLIFAAIIVVMGLFACLLLPETKGIPIDEMNQVWRKHWLWKRFFDEDDADQGGSKVKVTPEDI